MGSFSYVRILAFYNRAKNANAAWSLFDRAWQIIIAVITFVAAMIAWASSTWHWYWATFSWAGVAFAFLISCMGLALAFFLSGLGVHLWRRGARSLLTTPAIHFPTPHWHEPLKPIVSKHFRN